MAKGADVVDARAYRPATTKETHMFRNVKARATTLALGVAIPVALFIPAAAEARSSWS